MLKNKKIIWFLLLSLLLIIASSTISLSKIYADIPAVPSNLVSCSCATNATDTCLSGITVPSYMSTLGPFEYNGCVNSTTYQSFNLNSLGTVDYPATTLLSPAVGGSGFTMSGNANFVKTNATGGPGNPNTFKAGYPPSATLGTDLGVPCVRSGNISGTLHVTGHSIQTYMQCEYSCYFFTGNQFNYSCY